MINKFKKFANLTFEEKKLFIEAYSTLGKMRASILRVPFKQLTRSLEHHPKEIRLPKLNETELQKAIKIGQAITRAAAYTPWESACLAQSLTAKKMLQKRGISGVFYLGAMKSKESEAEMKVHAWSQCGSTVITGAGGYEEFTVISVFGWKNR